MTNLNLVAKQNMVVDAARKKNIKFALQDANNSLGRKLTIVESNKFKEIVDAQKIVWVNFFSQIEILVRIIDPEIKISEIL